MNIFKTTYTTPHGTVPFDRITLADFKPAILQGIEEEDAEVDAIVNNPKFPTFQNTVEALENTGETLRKVTDVFYNLLSAETSDELDALAQELSPALTEHSNNISLNKKLFQRIKTVYEEQAAKGFSELDKEQQRLLELTYKGFVRSGANLNDEDQQRLRAITEELNLLTLQFSQNTLKDTNDYTLHLTEAEDLKGLPPSSIEMARQEAKDRSLDGWVFTLQAPSYGPFMQYCDNQELRRQMYMARNTLCTHDNAYNNLEICKRLINLRLSYAQLLGYHTYADYVLEKRMAETPQKVYRLLNQLTDAYKPVALNEMEELRHFNQGDFSPWDFAYLSNKLQQQKHNLNSEMLRPYFELSKVKEGVFGLATRLYGITFKRNADIPVYHKDVEAYEVFDKDGSFLAVFYCDFFPRASKKSGAWMTSFCEQWIDSDGTNHRPHVSIVTNFTKPTEEKPSLLTLGEVETFLHEFGHSLHGMFANTRYRSLSGTNVLWDFVELPSQFMENYSTEKDFLNTFARHYETGEPMPGELIQRAQNARNFNVAYACMRQVSFGLLDMAYYTLTTPFSGDLKAFEKKAWQTAMVMPQLSGTCMTVQFSHIMAGGYSAGYYSYKWAEVLDADAFGKFKEDGIFNQATAQSFRDNILSRGNTEHPMTLYRRFRGKEPSIEALLIRNGIQ
ncbi:MAG: M3 family metallopeptidase [Bacteroidaceae bacterium]|nr:M3 family metallopeptidase [Bacteroidaceae bacterium]